MSLQYRQNRQELKRRIQKIHTNVADREGLTWDIYKFQYRYNDVYRSYVDTLNKKILRVDDIPYLPISAFKSREIKSGEWQQKVIYTSSGTSGQMPSRHFVLDESHYLLNTEKCFESLYGRSPRDFAILGLLPSYLERQGSSLVRMVDHFISLSAAPESGFFLHDFEGLFRSLTLLKESKKPTILFGVSFALLDFALQFKIHFPELIVIETGGMKGRKKEISRQELHTELALGFPTAKIQSEYGMTELFSQAYALKDGIFTLPSTMELQIMDPSDPFFKLKAGRPGVIYIKDLANIDSCAFIATEDVGRKYEDGRFEVLGRLDNSDIRGCSLMFA